MCAPPPRPDCIQRKRFCCGKKGGGEIVCYNRLESRIHGTRSFNFYRTAFVCHERCRFIVAGRRHPTWTVLRVIGAAVQTRPSYYR